MNYRKKLKSIKALVFDVDGVFSKEFLAMDNGEFYRPMNPKDGFALKRAVQTGFLTGIITGGNSQSVKDRFKTLGVTDVYLGQYVKIEAMEDFCAKYELSYEDVLYMGDDIPDYEVMKTVGFSACPADAASEIIEISDYISDKKAGEGCVRDIIEQVLKIQNKWIITGD
ncbi:MAG: HAD hydrolase family protein [Bacteroidales bacterium]|nr:HAD hydrolase family protein [Bacteroidales bacterium]